MPKKFLDSTGLEVLWDLIKQEVSNKSVVTMNTTSIWDKKESYIPTPGEIIVYTDYKEVTKADGEVIQTIPGIKIGDGRTSVKALEFITVSVAERVSHSLKIGDLIFDGSEDVTVAVYDGKIK